MSNFNDVKLERMLIIGYKGSSPIEMALIR